MEKVKINYDRTYSSKYTRDYYRGKSFHYAGRWEVGARYVCDEYNTDFVVHDSLLLICKKNHTATRNNEPIHLEELDNGLIGLQSDYWDVVLPALYGGSEYVVLGIEQERGTNVLHAMSQAATTRELEGIESVIEENREQINGDLQTLRTTVSRNAEEISSRAELIENDIATKWSEILQTADSIRTTVAANKSETDESLRNLQTNITQTTDTLRSEATAMREDIEGEIHNLSSTITQTASEIRSDVSDLQTNLEGQISGAQSSWSQTAEQINSRVENIEGDVATKWSEINQTADAISATVTANKTDADNNFSQLQSDLTITADTIRSEVSEVVDRIDGDISDTRSSITQTASKIRSEVESTVTDINGEIDTVKSSITQTASDIRSEIEATKTDLEGTISSNYSELKQTAEEISSTVASNKEAAEDALDAVNEELSSKITQTSEAITSEVEARTTREGEIVSDYMSKIEQTANAITSEVAAREALGERVTTAESNIRQNAEDISARVTKTDYNTDQETVNTKITEIVADTEGIHTSVSNIEQTLDSQGTVIGQYATRLTSLENQADNAIETWYYYGAPTLENVPASVWTDNETKDNHIGDLYYDRNTGYSYRFFKNDDVYSWSLMQDSDITKAIRNAAAAQETADGKMKVFTSTPYTPYQIGDLWVQGHTDNNDGTIYKCITDRESGAFNAADWAVASDFTSFKAVRSNFDIMADAIEGKVGTYDESGLIKGSTYSRIKQTRDNISLEIGTAKDEAIDTVTDGLSNTGINISDKKISLTADNIILKSNSGQRALEIVNDAEGKPLIAVSNLDVDSLRVKHLDGADGTFSGTLSAANGSFSGDVTATSLTLSGDLKIPYSKISDTPSIPTKAGDLTNDGTYITPTSITTLDVVAENLKVKAANIDGTLQVGNIPDLSGTYLTEHQSLADYMQTGTYIENGFIKTGFINTSAIQIGSGQVTGLGNLATKNKVDASTDVNGLSTVATSGNYNDLDGKPSIPDTSNLANKDVFAQKLGYTNYTALEAAAREGTTIIEGGHLRTSLIDADALRVKAANIEGTITATNLNAATGTFKGTLSGVTGDFTGTVHATTLTLGDNVVIDRSHLDIPEGEDMSAYVTNDSLSNTLQSYALSSSLSAYTTNEALGQTLQNYLTSASAESTYLKPSGLDGYLAGYIKTNVGVGSDNADSTYFIVDTNGLLTAKNAIITGQINATSGYIGGIAIGNNGIASDNNNFSVDKNGNVIANSITLANGAISSGINTYGFTFGKTNNIAYLYNGKSSLNTSGEGVYIGTDGIALGNSFKVTKNGTITLSYNSLSDKPSIPADVADLTDNTNKYLTEHQSLNDYVKTDTIIESGFIKTGLINASAITIGSSQVTGLASVATSGSYNDLNGKPSIPDVSNLADRDVFAQKLGYTNYADLVAKAAAGSTIIEGGHIRTSLIETSAITIGSGQVTGLGSLATKNMVSATGGDITGLGSLATKNKVNATSDVTGLSGVATSGNYNDLSNKPTIPDVSNLADKDVFAQNLGYTDYNALVAAAAEGQTLIYGGLIRTSLIDADALNVKAVNITGQLSASQINTNGLTIGSGQVSGLGSLATKNDIGTSDLNSTIISGGYIKTELIKASELQVSAAKITGTLTASQIDATDLHVSSVNIDGDITATNLNAATGTFTGTLSAATGSFSGAVTATGGYIGGWEISPTSLISYGSSGSVILTTSGDYAMWAGTSTNPANAQFSIKYDGSVKASNIDLTGGYITGRLELGNNGQIFSSNTSGSSWRTNTVNISADSITSTSRSSASASISYTSEITGTKVEVRDQNGRRTYLTAGGVTYEYDNGMKHAIFGDFAYSITVVSSLPSSPNSSTLYFVTE